MHFFYIIIFTLQHLIVIISGVFHDHEHIAGKPLFLTPFIKSGKITEAREKSKVTSFTKNVISNSGFLTVNQTHKVNLFFWFFQKTSLDWKKASVLLWLQGGPGCSSLLALFKENGPYEIIDGKVHARKYAWTDEYNVLFIDNPVGSGYSFSNNHYPQTEEQVADHLYEALIQFFQMYPELRRNNFYITGESYAGKYIPAIAYKIHETNAEPLPLHRIALKGLIIGNGFSDPENMVDFGVHLHRLGLIDHQTKSNLECVQEKTKIFIRNKLWNEALSENGRILRIIRNATAFTSLFDYINNGEGSDKSFLSFLQNNNTRKAIHVGSLSFEVCSTEVFLNLKTDVMKSVRVWLEQLLERYPILFYNGMLDIRVTHFLTTKFLDELHWSGAKKFKFSSREIWYVDGRVAGYYKSADNLKYALVRDAGHMVPSSKPKAMLNLINKFINDTI